MMPWGAVRLAIGRIWFATAIVAGAVHAATYLGIDPMTWCPALWKTQILVVVAGFSTLLSGNVRPLPRGSSVLDPLEPELPLGGAANVDDADLARLMRPNRRKLIAAGLAAYAVVTFFVSLGILEGGQPGQRDGSYLLVAHGKSSRHSPSHSTGGDLAVQTRFATGYWMFVFYLAAAIWSMQRPRPSLQGGLATLSSRGAA